MVRWVKQAASGAKAVVKLVEYAEMGATMKGHKVFSNLFLIVDSINRPDKALFGRSKTYPPKTIPVAASLTFTYIYMIGMPYAASCLFVIGVRGVNLW